MMVRLELGVKTPCWVLKEQPGPDLPPGMTRAWGWGLFVQCQAHWRTHTVVMPAPWWGWGGGLVGAGLVWVGCGLRIV